MRDLTLAESNAWSLIAGPSRRQYKGTSPDPDCDGLVMVDAWWKPKKQQKAPMGRPGGSSNKPQWAGQHAAATNYADLTLDRRLVITILNCTAHVLNTVRIDGEVVLLKR